MFYYFYRFLLSSCVCQLLKVDDDDDDFLSLEKILETHQFDSVNVRQLMFVLL